MPARTAPPPKAMPAVLARYPKRHPQSPKPRAARLDPDPPHLCERGLRRDHLAVDLQRAREQRLRAAVQQRLFLRHELVHARVAAAAKDRPHRGVRGVAQRGVAQAQREVGEAAVVACGACVVGWREARAGGRRVVMLAGPRSKLQVDAGPCSCLLRFWA